VSKADFKFNAAHFVAYRGFRERLHGHNYTVGVRLLGSRKISHDGYVLDFGDVKSVVKKVCKQLNERFLCPNKSDVIDIKIVEEVNNNKNNNDNGESSSESNSKSVILICEDGAKFVIPHDDCAMLPIEHATVEELAIYVWSEILDGLDSKILRQRGIHTMEVVMAEAPGQEAVFRYGVPEITTECAKESRKGLDVLSFIMNGENELTPKPCLDPGQQQETNKFQKLSTSAIATLNKTADPTDAKDACCCDNSCGRFSFSKQLEELASALNEKRQSADDSGGTGEITANDLRSILEKKNQHSL